MPRARSPNREKAEKMWLESDGTKPLVEIARELGLGDSQIRKWKNIDEWEVKLEEIRNGNVTNQRVESKGNVTKRKGAGAPSENQNAVGNKGGRGAPKGNHYATGNAGGGPPLRNENSLKTGEYRSLWEEALSEDDRLKLDSVNVDPLAQFDSQLRLFEYRELMIMKTINQLKAGLDEKERRVLQQRQKIKESVPVHNEKTGETKSVTVERHEMVVVEIEEMEFRRVDDILKHEEALARVTERKAKVTKSKAAYLAMLQKLSIDQERLEIDKAKVNKQFDPLSAINKELRDASQEQVKSAWGARPAQARQDIDASDGEV